MARNPGEEPTFAVNPGGNVTLSAEEEKNKSKYEAQQKALKEKADKELAEVVKGAKGREDCPWCNHEDSEHSDNFHPNGKKKQASKMIIEGGRLQCLTCGKKWPTSLAKNAKWSLELERGEQWAAEVRHRRILEGVPANTPLPAKD